MKSLTKLYKIGRGPSSSHTMGPANAVLRFLNKYPQTDYAVVILKGSLAKTGKGHLTDKIIKETFNPVPVKVIFDEKDKKISHPNTMHISGYKDNIKIADMSVLSVGGGEIRIEGEEPKKEEDIYPHKSFAEISGYCRQKGIRIPQYVREFEGASIDEYLYNIYNTMKKSISDGLSAEGVLEGGLGIERKAKFLYSQRHMDESPETRENRIVCAYAFAVSEQNAGGGVVVTAPTCGSSGILPAVLLYTQQKRGFSDKEIIDALATAGIIGNLIKENASISGAECGCQAEVGSACSMAAAALAELFGMDYIQIEYAAEVAMEHHLGLTCDPVCGLVQIPCIERNAVAAMRAINAVSLANFLSSTRKISFDMVVNTMYKTGTDLLSKYRETSEGGLAELY